MATVAFSVEPSQSPSGTFTPSVVIPSATTLVRPLQLDPVEHQHRQAHVVEAAAHQLAQGLARARDERAARPPTSTSSRLGLDLLADRLARALVAPGARRRRASARDDPR